MEISTKIKFARPPPHLGIEVDNHIENVAS